MDCGNLKDNWTRGSVVEADDVSSLAWKFQKLLASLKNLIDLSAKDSNFYVDPGTSKLELYIRGELPSWQVKTPDGKSFCSSEQSQSETCSSIFDSSIGITTITIRPAVAAKSGGSWSLSPAVENDKLLVFGGIDVPPGSPYLTVSPNEKPIQVDEGKSQTFSASILNADGSAFNQSGYQSVQICASVSSGSTPSCKEGTSVEGLEVSPSVSDQSVFIQAKLVSKIPDRNYLISKSMPIEVAPSMNFATLACEKDPCKLADIKNKNKKAMSNLRVDAPRSGANSSQIYLVEYSILKDGIRGRGDGNINFEIQKPDGKVVNWNDKTQLFSAGDRLILSASTKIGGASEIAGVIKYVSKNGDKEISRQLKYTFKVGNKVNLPLEIFLILGTYLLTLGLPYLFLLWMARRGAYLDAPDNEIGIATSSFVISPLGKLVSVNAEGVEDLTLSPPPHGKIAQKQIEKRKRNLVLEETQQRVELIVVPPKWNPFAEPKAIVNIPGSHVMTTVNGSGFEPEKAGFTSFLANDAILYFESEPNLAPVKNEKVVDDTSSASGDLFASAYEKKISSELEKNTGSIKGKVIYIVPFLSNRKKSLAELTSKIMSISEAGKLKENISELREKHLNAALENQIKEQQEESSKAQKSKGRKVPTEEKKVEVEQPADDWMSGDKTRQKNNMWGDGDDGFPTSSSGTKLWE